MPILGDSKKFSPPKQSYFESLEELDEWAGTSSPVIFEGGGEQDSLRLLVGKLPKSRTGPVSQPTTPTSLPLSPHYARILADLAKKRGFDGYLLNFECPLVGGIEQTRALAAWITILQAELKYKIGDHAEAMCLDSTLTGDAHTYPHIHRKKLHDIYMGVAGWVDVWGRGSHGNGGFGSFKAISHIAPSSLGLSVALFGQAWTWESEQDKPGWNWDSWWTYERKLWAGKADPAEEITVPVMPPLKNGESPCEVGVHDVFTPIVSYFQRTPPPDPLLLPFHTTFSPGVGRRWFVKGREVFHRPEGWTDIDKQTSLGDMVWPKPIVSWEGEIMDPEGLDLPNAKSQICMDNAWNGGSSLRLSLVAFGTESENAAFRCIWIPVQSLATSVGRMYEASAVYKLETDVAGVDIDVALSIKGSESSPTTRYPKFDIESLPSEDMDLGRGWSLLKIRFNLGNSIIGDVNRLSSMGLVITIVSEETTQPLAFSLLLGQLNVYPSIPSSIPPHVTSLLWAHFSPSEPETTSFPNVPASLGVLTWEISTSFPSHALPRITSPDDPLAAWPAQPSAEAWFPKLLYANVYALEYQTDGTPSKVEDAIWIGTSGCGYEGMRNTFIVQSGIALSSTPDTATAGEGVLRIGNGKMRFYVQGVTETGNVLDWTRFPSEDPLASFCMWNFDIDSVNPVVEEH
ncbi:hypothetical protein HHX47_DHR7000720 [Lentinula edodes]|nr:hypothetical protein HHX47_DHR7000720 [Lentinula edodes]